MLLIINSDDFGYCPQRNAAVVKAFTEGCLTSATLLVNATHARAACQLAQQHGIPLGLHVNVTEGRPVLPPQEVASLLTPEGVFHGKFGFFAALKAGTIDLQQVC